MQVFFIKNTGFWMILDDFYESFFRELLCLRNKAQHVGANCVRPHSCLRFRPHPPQ
jgi:hypothetical protein